MLYEVITDLTFGGGGHTFYFLSQVDKLKMLAFDQDAEAYQNGLKSYNFV